MKHPHSKKGFTSIAENSAAPIAQNSAAPIAQNSAPHCSAGFTLLFAALVASLVLSIGIAVFNITLKELRLSSAGRESQFAFFAADTGAECALYWDQQKKAFHNTDSDGNPIATSITCAGNPPATVGGGPIGTEYTFTLQFSPEAYCVEVFVQKELIGLKLKTTIRSFGRNSCDPNAPQRVERAIRVRY